MKAGDLVEYIPWHNNFETPIRGLVLQVDGQPDCYSNVCNIRVRWFEHMNSQRDWYTQEELSVISKCMDSK
jgi:hypothetical protein